MCSCIECIGDQPEPTQADLETYLRENSARLVTLEAENARLRQFHKSIMGLRSQARMGIIFTIHDTWLVEQHRKVAIPDPTEERSPVHVQPLGRNIG